VLIAPDKPSGYFDGKMASYPASNGVSYLLGPDDRILAVDETWDEVARRDGAEELTRDRVIGQSLRACISDPQTREIFSLLLAAARRSRRTIHLPFRCDTPGVRRFMRLAIDPQADGSLLLRTSLLRAEPRPPVALLDSTARRSTDFLKICGWCKKVPLPSGTWVEIEDATAQLSLFASGELPRLSHGICPTCARQLEAEIDSAGLG
jgi:hypothetical protein